MTDTFDTHKSKAMTDILTELRKVESLNGDTYSSMEVLGMVSRAADEIDRVRAVASGLQSIVMDLLDALRSVVAIADRKTDEFDRARAAIAKAEGKPLTL